MADNRQQPHQGHPQMMRNPMARNRLRTCEPSANPETPRQRRKVTCLFYMRHDAL
ncbi:hypothetical protein SAMN05216358_3989 [Rhizobium sp. AN5]|nr:hypothetical protein SAMN05216358_3989 [Rhizobium sp. AN5]